jgi:hypothetical protein
LTDHGEWIKRELKSALRRSQEGIHVGGLLTVTNWIILCLLRGDQTQSESQFAFFFLFANTWQLTILASINSHKFVSFLEFEIWSFSGYSTNILMLKVFAILFLKALFTFPSFFLQFNRLLGEFDILHKIEKIKLKSGVTNVRINKVPFFDLNNQLVGI